MPDMYHVLKGKLVDPTTTPTRIGQHWINTVLKTHWLSVGTSSPSDWVLQTSGSLFYANLAAFPLVGADYVLYVANDTNKIFKWDGSAYVEVSTGVTDHTQLSNIGNLTHLQLESAIDGKEAVGVAAGLVSAHEAAVNPHVQYATDTDLSNHINDTANPHSVTKSQVGLANADNTSDLNKPISTATQTALNLKENTIVAGTTGQYFRGDKTWQTLDKTAVGLSNVDNTSDLSKPISTLTQTALDLKTTGAASSTDNAIARFDGITGKIIQNSSAIIDDSGNVGFGSPTIAARLHVKGSDETSATKSFRVDNSSNTELFTVRDDGNVGIGATSPATKLDVNGASTFRGNITLPDRGLRISIGTYGTISETRGGAGYVTGNNIAAHPSSTNTLIKTASAPDRAQYIFMRFDRGIYFATGIGAGDAIGTTYADDVNRRLSIMNTGDVGINTASPTARLHVKGTGNTSATTAFKVDNSSNIEKFSVRNDGLVQFDEFVSAKTADYTVLSTDKKTLFSNTGAAGTVNFTLPTAVSGLHYKFYCNAAQSIRVTASAGDVIRRGASVTASAGNVLTPAALGNYFEVVAIDSATWVITQSVETSAYTFT